jgi:cell division protease FtsH
VAVDGRQDGLMVPATRGVSEYTQRLIDEEVRRIIDEAEHDTILLLERERDRLEALARALLEKETLDQPEAYQIAGREAPPSAEGEAAARPARA